MGLKLADRRTPPLKGPRKDKTSIFDLYDAEDAAKRYGEKDPQTFGEYFKLTDRMKERRPFEVARDISGSRDSDIDISPTDDTKKKMMIRQRKVK